MKLEKKHWVIIGVVIIIIILVWYSFRSKKNGGNAKAFIPGQAHTPGQAPGVIKPIGKGSGTDSTAVQDTAENSFRGGRHGGGGRWHHGGRGGWGGYWGGYGGYPWPYDDEPVIVVNSTRCPQGWIWMGAMLGCQKPQGM